MPEQVELAANKTIDESSRAARRAALVLEHMQSENVQEWDRTMATFSHARYELPHGSVFDGDADVMQYWIDGRTVVPDQRNELIELRCLNDGQVQIEFWLRGTPTTTNRPFVRRVWAVFAFDDDDLMTNERVYMSAPTDDQIAGLIVSTAGDVDARSRQ